MHFLKIIDIFPCTIGYDRPIVVIALLGMQE